MRRSDDVTHLVLLETNGNQRFIFSSPRLRDNIGASALLTKLKRWAACELVATGAASAWLRACGLPDDVQEPDDSQWVSKSSGKVIFLVDSEERARDVIGAVTRKALAEAPGMDVSGVFIPLASSVGAQTPIAYVTGEDLKKVHAEAARYALRRPPSAARFSQIPFLARAKDSALPASPPLASRDEAKDDRRDWLSLTSRVRRYRAYEARVSLMKIAAKSSKSLEDDNEILTRDPTKLAEKLRQAFTGNAPQGDDVGKAPARAEKDVRQLENAIQSNQDPDETADSREYAFLSKVAVIHIDGNGVGGVMKDLDASKGRVDPDVFMDEIGCGRDHPDALRRFLLKVNDNLDKAVTRAFAAAWAWIAKLSRHDDERAGRRHTAIPVVPVILGGDDVTVITSGDYAIPFADAYLRYYEEATQQDPVLRYLTPPEGQATGPMTAAAGVAVVKRNFPFHIAYELAERLVERAKKVGKTTQPPCSTLDYHALFDTTVLDADEALRGYSAFTTRPFRMVDDAASPSCTCNDCRGAAASGDERGSSSDSSKKGLCHEEWKATCGRVARFKGLSLRSADESENKTDLQPFPRTRAARIRGLLSAAAQEQVERPDGKEAKHPDGKANEKPNARTSGNNPDAESPGRKKDSLTRARDEWKVARQELGEWIDRELGGMHAVFDLLELADILPGSFFELPLPALNDAVPGPKGSDGTKDRAAACATSPSTSCNPASEAIS